MGTGSTVLAALRNSRDYLDAEIDREYFTVAPKRIKEVSEHGLYDTIVELEERIEDAKLRRSSIEMEAITLDNMLLVLKKAACVCQ